jgi:hypothetical protein
MKTQLFKDEDNFNNKEDHSFFGIFEMNKDVWLLNSNIENIGYIYMHRNTYRPLLILLNREINEETKTIEVEQVIFMTTTKQFEIENRILTGTYTLLDGIENKEENKTRINYYIDKFINKFNEDGEIKEEGEKTVLSYWRKFLNDTKLNLTFDFDVLDRNCKKRKC